MHIHAFAAFLIAALAGSPRVSAQTTYIVDATGGPGSHFQQIQAAVNAAADGDALRIRPGTYAPFRVAGKGLRIVGDDTAGVIVQGSTDIEIGPLAPGQDVLLEGLSTEPAGQWGAPPTLVPRLFVHDAASSVVLRWLRLGASPTPFVMFSTYAGGVEITRCAQVHAEDVVVRVPGGATPATHVEMVRVVLSYVSLARVQIEGHAGDSITMQGSVGVLLDRSNVFVAASTIRGGHGGSARTASPGGTAIRAINGSALVVAAGTGANSVQGGDGSTWQNWWWSASGAGDGGAGIEVLSGSSARFEGTAPLGGNPGSNIGNTAVAGPPSIVAAGATLLVRSSTSPAIAAITGTPAPGGSVRFAFEGEPNAPAFVLIGLAAC